VPAAPKPTESEVDHAQLESSIASFIKDFWVHNDADEACECAKLLNAPNFHHMIVFHGVKLALEAKSADRNHTTTLFAEMHGKGVLTSEDIMKGVTDLVSDDIFSEIAEDLPYAGKFLGAMWGTWLNEDCVPTTSFSPEFYGSLSESQKKSFLTCTLSTIRDVKGADAAATYYKSAVLASHLDETTLAEVLSSSNA